MKPYGYHESIWFIHVHLTHILVPFLIFLVGFQEKSSRLWAFVIAAYWVSFVTYYLLWKAYNHVSGLRASALMSPDVRAEQFSVLVRDIPSPPEGQTRKEQVDSYFKAIYPDTFYRSMVVTDNKEVTYLIDLAHTELVCCRFLIYFISVFCKTF